MDERIGFGYNAFRELYIQKRLNKWMAEHGGDSWKVSFSGSEAYSARLYDVLRTYSRSNVIDIERSRGRKPLDIIRLLVNRKKMERVEVKAADIMGYGAVLRDLDINGVAIALTDARTEQMKLYDEEHDIQMIVGDVFSTRTWNKLDALYPEQEYFDFLLCSPNGASPRIPDSIEISAYLLSRIYPHLSRNHGIFLTEIHSKDCVNTEFVSSVEVLNNLPGISTFIGMNSFMLVKDQEAPDFLSYNSSKQL